MNKHNILPLFACLLASAGAASAISYSGSITVEAGTLVVGGGWPSTTTGGLSWVVDNTTNAGSWTYTYIFNMVGAPDISHAIVEVTDGALPSDFNVNAGVGAEIEVGTFGVSSGNPGILGDIFGIKINTPDDTDEPWSWTIVTERNPVWQDFYAKGGSNSFAHNSGYLAADPADGPANGSLQGHILGPNGGTPTPNISTPDGGTTMSLMGLCLVGLGALRRFFNTTK